MIKVGSLFTQVLSLVDRRDFARAVAESEAEHAAKGFRCLDQFVAMVFCQLAGADSLREISGGLATAMGKLTHLGLKDAPARSTLSYANQHRPWQLFENVFYQVYEQAQHLAFRQKRRFRKHKAGYGAQNGGTADPDRAFRIDKSCQDTEPQSNENNENNNEYSVLIP